MGIGIRGEPELFRRRSLLFNAESMGCCAVTEAFPGRTDGITVVGRGAESVLSSIDMTEGFGLKVTFRAFRCASRELEAAEWRRGVFSVVVLVEAIANQLEEECSA